MIALPFGRSGTIALSLDGAEMAPQSIALEHVSVTGSEYPTLYGATSHVEADMFVAGAMLQLKADPARLRNLVSSQCGEYTGERPSRGDLHPHGHRAARFLDAAMTSGSLEAESASPWWYRDDCPGEALVAGDERGFVLLTTATPLAHRCINRIHQSACDDRVIALFVNAVRPYGSPLLLEDAAHPTHATSDLSAEDIALPGAGAGDGDDQGQPSLLDLAERVRAVPVVARTPVQLSGNLARDVLALTGLTAADLATTVGRTERSVRNWIADEESPPSVRPTLQQLRTIGLRLVGGLGAGGARAWLTAGQPTPLERITAGDAVGVLYESEDLLDSPAT